MFYYPADPLNVNNLPYLEIYSKFHSGLLSQEEIEDAVYENISKGYLNPALDCLLAQFYDFSRDINSLRKIAVSYVLKDMPVPLDIVLYGGGEISEHDGLLYADISAVHKQKFDSASRKNKHEYYEYTSMIRRYPIAGRIPWMRQAWSAVETANCSRSAEAWRTKALSAIKYLESGLFTVINAKGLEALLDLGLSTAKPRTLKPSRFSSRH